MEGYIAEVRMFGGNFAPQTWHVCNGQQLSISVYTTLYSLIGTVFGGDGASTFNLPNLGSRVPGGVGQGTGLSPYTLGQASGTETVTLGTSNLPAHSHIAAITNSSVPTPSATGTLYGSAAGGGSTPSGSLLGVDNNLSTLYAPSGSTLSPMASSAVSITTFYGPQPNIVIAPVGGNTAHDNMQPYTVINYIICLEGIYPSRN